MAVLDWWSYLDNSRAEDLTIEFSYSIKHSGRFRISRNCGKVKHELRVTSSNTRVTSSNPRVTSSNPRVQIHKLQVQIYELRVQIHE